MDFPPNSSLVESVAPSPNFDDRLEASPDMIVLHYTGMEDPNAAFERLRDPEAKVSCHYLVFEDGRIVQMVPEDRRAWHAGISSWEGRDDINSRSIGIEICNPGHDFGYPSFPSRQIAATTALCRGIVARRAIRRDRVVAHSDIAPMRKRDPGEKFPWKLLSESGIGLWVEPTPITDWLVMVPGDEGDGVLALQRALSEYGYGVPLHGQYEDVTAEVVRAFQRHFRPAQVDGMVDTSTRETLKRLLEARAALPTPGAPLAASSSAS